MTRIDSSPERDPPSSSQTPALDSANQNLADEEPINHRLSAEVADDSTRKAPQTTTIPQRRPKRPSAGRACCKASIFTVLIVIIAYFWLSWTDPDEIARRQRAWDAAMEKIRGKQIIHAPRYNDQYRFRPAASPIITETMKDGRKKIKGGRPGDSDDKPPKPTATPPPRKVNRKKNKPGKSGKGKKRN